MLANILSKKSFFVQIILGIVFSVFFFNELYREDLLVSNIWGISAFITYLVVCCFFFAASKLFKSPGLPFWFFIIWTLVFSDIALDTRVAVSLLVCTILFWRMVRAEEKSDSKNYAFDVGICLSIAGFFYPPAVLLIVLILFNYLYMQSLNLRVILLFILGFAFPLAVGFQVLYLTDNLGWAVEMKAYFKTDFWSYTNLLWLLPVGVLVVLSWVDHLSHSGTQDINKRHIYFLFFLYFLNWLIILILTGGNDVGLLAVAGLPLSVFLGRYIQYQESRVWREIVLWGFLTTMAGFYFRYEIMDIYDELLGNVVF